MADEIAYGLAGEVVDDWRLEGRPIESELAADLLARLRAEIARLAALEQAARAWAEMTRVGGEADEFLVDQLLAAVAVLDAPPAAD